MLGKCKKRTFYSCAMNRNLTDILKEVKKETVIEAETEKTKKITD